MSQLESPELLSHRKKIREQNFSFIHYKGLRYYAKAYGRHKKRVYYKYSKGFLTEHKVSKKNINYAIIDWEKDLDMNDGVMESFVLDMNIMHVEFETFGITFKKTYNTSFPTTKATAERRIYLIKNNADMEGMNYILLTKIFCSFCFVFDQYRLFISNLIITKKQKTKQCQYQ